MAKKEYILSTGNLKSYELEFVYKYGLTKNIQLFVDRSDFRLRVLRDSKTDFDSVLEDGIFRDGIKKALLMQFLHFGECGSVDYLSLSINGEVKTVFSKEESLSGRSLVYTLGGNKLVTPLPEEWKNQEVIATLLNTPKSGYDRRFAALFAVIMAHTKEQETEKFLYQWMAINGIYGYVKEIANEATSNAKAKKWLKNEFAQLKFLTLIMGYDYAMHSITGEEVKRRVWHRLEAVCQKMPASEVEAFIKACKENDSSNRYVMEVLDVIHQEDPGNVSHPYMVMIIWLAYQIRCKYFHGENAVPMFSFRNEHPLPALHILNVMLGEYLDMNLYHWFMDEGQKEKIGKKISGCGFNKEGFTGCDDNSVIQVYFKK